MKELDNSFANEKSFIIRGFYEFSFAGSFAGITTLQKTVNKL